MASEIIFVVEEDTDGGYTARVISHSIFTQGDTLVQLEGCVAKGFWPVL